MRNGPIPLAFASSTADSSQVMATGSLYGSGGVRNADTSLPFPSNLSAANTTLYPNHFAQARRKKFLHFTRSSNTLLDLSIEIAEKCEKMYPSLNEEIEILSLQDNSGCDLDPDFYVKDVFNIDNTVRVILRNELDIDESSPVSLYRSQKKKKLNNGLGQSQLQPQTQSNSVQSLPPASSSSANGGVLKIAKKRPSGTIKRHPMNSNMRISTPLAHQIYPPPNSDRLVSNNSDEEDVGERSFLPPPAQPQSPPIRISSGIEKSKRIRSAMEEDAVSRSETVDPDKSKQQRLLSGTPIRPAMTPNRVTLTGQRVVSEHVSSGESRGGIFATASASSNKANGTRIVSGMLSIPEPRIAEIEKELKEGPSSPASLLPAVPDRIPMKEPYQKIADRVSDDNSSSDEQATDVPGKVSALRQTSIADNGSPVKDSPRGADLGNVHLAELPESRSPSMPAQRKTSLEARVENKSSGPSSQTTGADEPLRKVNFSEEEDEEEDESDSGSPEARLSEDQSNKHNNNGKGEREGDEEEEEEEEEGDNTVLITRNDQESKSFSNSSIQKTEFLKLMENESNELPPWFQNSAPASASKSKPYTTVLHKDIDNSKPDPRNIMPKHTPRSAARKAAQLLMGKQGHDAKEINSQKSTNSTSSSDIETDSSLDEDHDKISINENNSIKTLNLHPLKEKVISSQDSKLADKESQSIAPSTENASIPPTKDNSTSNVAIEKENSIKPTEPPATGEPVTKAAVSTDQIDKLDNKKAVTDNSSPESPKASANDAKRPEPVDDIADREKPSKSHVPTNQESPKKPLVAAGNTVEKGPNTGEVKLTKKQEAEIKRREREATRAAKLEAAQKLKAEREAMKAAKQKAKEEAKLAREAEAAKKKLERENKRKAKMEEEKRRKQEMATKKVEKITPKKADDSQREPMGRANSGPVQDGNDRLKELKAKFTKSRAYVPAGLISQKVTRSNEDSESDSSNNDSSSDGSSSSSDEEDSSASKKSRRLIVDTPKGSLNLGPSQKPVTHLSGVEDAPQSTQQSNPSSQETPHKVPVTKMMEMSSPASARKENGRSSFLQSLPQKVRPSLSSLSDLVSRGVPDVREKSTTTPHVGSKKGTAPSSGDSNDDDEGSEDEESVSESSDSDSDSDNSSTDGSSFISAKSASTALGKKKRGSGGFASLLKDSKKA